MSESNHFETIDYIVEYCGKIEEDCGFRDGADTTNQFYLTTKIALAMTECAEIIEALRKPHLPAKVEGVTLEEEEIADAVIRLFAYAQLRGFKHLGRTMQRKCEINQGRGYKFGKQF